MADSEVSGLTESTSIDGEDQLYCVDVSESTDADKSKHMTVSTFINSMLTHGGAVLTHSGNVLTHG